MNTTDYNWAKASPEDKVHTFSRWVASTHKYKAAILIAYFAYRLLRSKHWHKGQRWFYETLESLAERYPYLGRTTIHDVLKRLKTKGVLMTGRFNKKGYDRTIWYAIPDATLLQKASLKPIRFSAADAVAFNVPAAVLLLNLTYWVGKNRLAKDAQYKWHRMSAGELKSTVQIRTTIPV